MNSFLAAVDLYFAERALAEEPHPKQEHLAFLAAAFALSRQGHLAFSLEMIEEILQSGPVCRTLPPCCATYICEKDGIFYLQKNWACEEEIAHHIQRLSKAALRPISLTLPDILNNEQKTALAHARVHPVSLLCGGPGTGKTFTAAQLIQAFLAEDTEHKMRVAIAAPTGKAVAQLDAYLRRHIGSDKRIRSGTCHALLGIKNESTPPVLFADLLLVDECSMIDAAVFARLLASTLTGTRLILVGDPEQLPAVEAGSIFADLVDSGMLPCAPLQRSLRSDREEILSFAAAIRTADVAAVRQMLKGLRLDLSVNLYEAFSGRFPSFFTHEPAMEELADGFRLLSCMRQGPFGVDAINALFAAQFLKEAKKKSVSGWWGIPILITRNDYGLQLFNGDTGVLVKRLSPSLSLTESSKEDYAVFPALGRTVPALALPAYEWGYCLSVHKSQGSEYDEVVVLIPEGSHVFGREVLYTAVTRARRSIRLAGSLEDIELVIEKSARKISGLSARLKNKIRSL